MKFMLLISFAILLRGNPLAASGIRYAKPGARPNSMGTAFSSVPGDPYNLYYNPAGLSEIEYPSVSAEIARRFSPEKGAGEVSLIYVRPQPDRKNDVAAIGFHSIRQGGTGKKDSLSVGYSGLKTIKHFQKPVRWGIDARIMRYCAEGKTSFGLMLGGGILLESESGFNTSLYLDNMGFGVSDPMSVFTIGNSIRLNSYIFALDFKLRKGKSEFFPGIEKIFLNDLIRARVGKGFSIGGEDFLSAGVGVNLLPYTLDFSASLPWKGLSAEAGHFSVGLSYRFGGGSFSDKLIGNASQKIKELQSRIDELRARRAELGTQVATFQVNKNILASEIAVLRSRQLELENTLKELEISIANARYRKEEPKPKQVKRIIRKKRKWPRKYKVRKGDTLRSISSRFYGSPSLWETIYQANERKIFRGLPVEGAVLIIPPPPRR